MKLVKPLIGPRIGQFGFLIVVTALLTGCFESSNNSIANLSGSVGDGPIIDANIEVLDSAGNQIASGTSDNTASYQLSIDTPSESYPLTIIATGGIDLVTGTPADFAMKSVAMNASPDVTANINPFTTLMVMTAQRSASGLNAGSLFAAETAVLEQLNFGLDPVLLPDPVSTTINGTNIASVVKASEAAGEMVRRVASALAAAGFARSPDEVVAALAADLVDGVVDGRGASGSDARVAAVTNLVAAQVTVETMSNDLTVLGLRAESLMDNAILVSIPGAPDSARTGNVTLNPELKSQALLALGAASALNPSATVDAAMSAVSQLSVGATAAQARAALPAQASSALGATVSMVAQGSAADLELVNDFVRSDGSTEAPVNRAPEISGIPANSVTAGGSYYFRPQAVDADGDALSFSIVNKPSWASFNAGNGQLAGTPASTDVAVWGSIQISVSDGLLSASLPVFSITVNEDDTTPPPPPPPPPPSADAGLYANGALVDGAVLNPELTTFEYVAESGVVEVKAWCCAATGESHAFRDTDASAPFEFTIDLSQYSAGVSREFYLDRVLSDGTVVQGYTANFTISGESPPPPPPANNPPSISGSPAGNVQVDQTYFFQPSASDPDGDSLQFSIANKPGWASFSSSTGALSGTPGDSDVGSTSNIVISVSDGSASASLAPFSITVSEAAPENRAPVISGNPANSVQAGETYSFVPNASDPDGDSLQFSIANKPGWASFSSSNGSLSGTPGDSDVGSTSNIVISVSDGSASASLAPFSITVSEAPQENRAPVISGNPADSVLAGETYAFVPNASDPDGDSLQFSVQNLPSWASFDPSSGALSGSPESADAGTYYDVTISVSDGSLSASLPAFDITVTDVATGYALLSWIPPTERVDGTPLDQLAGYKVYRGMSPEALELEANITDHLTVDYYFDNLQSGTHYFAVQAYDESGLDSALSNVASKTIN